MVFVRNQKWAPVIRAESHLGIGRLPPADRAPFHPFLPPKEGDDRDKQEQKEEGEPKAPEQERNSKRAREQDQSNLPGLRSATSRTANAGRASAAGPRSTARFRPPRRLESSPAPTPAQRTCSGGLDPAIRCTA